MGVLKQKSRIYTVVFRHSGRSEKEIHYTRRRTFRFRSEDDPNPELTDQFWEWPCRKAKRGKLVTRDAQYLSARDYRALMQKIDEGELTEEYLRELTDKDRPGYEEVGGVMFRWSKNENGRAIIKTSPGLVGRMTSEDS